MINGGESVAMKPALEGLIYSFGQEVQQGTFRISALRLDTFTLRRKRYDALCYHSHTTFVYLHIEVA